MARVIDSAVCAAEEVNPRAKNLAPVARFLGLKITHLTRDRITAELAVRGELANRNNVLSGGVVMSLADILGGTAASANLTPGTRTATLESKTNFFASVPLGDTAFAECIPLHRGRSTMVFETRITRGDGKLAAVVTQTQIVLPKSAEK